MVANRECSLRGLVLGLLLLLSGGAAPAPAREGGPDAREKLVVIVRDDSTGRPVEGVRAWVTRRGERADVTVLEPGWRAFTDCVGVAQLLRIPPGTYNLNVCSNLYERDGRAHRVTAGRVDTVVFSLRYLGPPDDGRRCEEALEIDLAKSSPTNGVVVLTSGPEVGPSARASSTDPAHCNARVIVRLAESGEPIAGALVQLRAATPRGRPPIGSDRSVSTDAAGVAEFAALPVADYAVMVRGISRRREVQDWQPPPCPHEEVGRGAGAYPRPYEAQEFAYCGTWTVRDGDCGDTLVVLIPATEWRIVTGYRRNHVDPPCGWRD